MLDQLAACRDVLLEIDIEGARQIKASYPQAELIFLMPPSAEVLARRLTGRGTETEAQVAERLARSEREMAESKHFDYTIVNDDLAQTVQAVEELMDKGKEAAHAAS